MRPFLPWPQQLLAPLAVFAALIYGISLDVRAQEDYQRFWTSRDIPTFIREIVSFPFFADAREERRGRNDKPTPTPRQTPASSPSPEVTPRLSPTVSIEPDPSITPVVPILVIETPTPSPSPEQIALNLDLDSARDIIRGAVQTIGGGSSFGGFKVGTSGKPYPYGGGKLDTATTMKLYSLAGMMAMLGAALFTFNSRKS